MTLLTSKNEGKVLGEQAELDYFKAQLYQSLNSGTPIDSPSLDKVKSQIALLENNKQNTTRKIL